MAQITSRLCASKFTPTAVSAESTSLTVYTLKTSSQPSSSFTYLSNRRRRPSNCFSSSNSSSSFKQNRWPELPEEAAAQVEGVGVTMISNKESFFTTTSKKCSNSPLLIGSSF